MPVWHEITPISRTNPFGQETQRQTQQKDGGAGRLDCLPFKLDRWLTGCTRCPQDDIFHSLLFLTMPPHIPSEGHDGQRATTTNQPLSNLLFRGPLLLRRSLGRGLRSNGGYVGLTWEAENHNIGQWGNATYPWRKSPELGLCWSSITLRFLDALTCS